MKHFALWIFCNLFFASILFSQEISLAQAAEIANNFYKKQCNISASDSRFQNSTIAETKTISEQGLALVYIFNFAPTGFVIVSASDKTYPVLGYSYESNFSLNDAPESITKWMDSYKQSIHFLIKNKALPTKEIKVTWENISNNDTIKKEKTVLPLLKTKWGQGVYYNAKCPEAEYGPGGYCVAGCVAVSLAQTLNYYNFPQYPVGSDFYNYNNKTEYVNFNDRRINWSYMKDSLNTPNNAVAELIFLSGVAVNTAYSDNNSGAGTAFCKSGLINHFKYSPSIKFITKENYTDSAWAAVLIENLDNKRPVIYRGVDSTGIFSHSFVCDGYSGSNFFHFNWGWNGSNNGYFLINNLNPSYLFSENHGAIVNIYPDTINYLYPEQCSGNRVFTAETDSFDDGSSPLFSYPPNSNCSWLIAPTNMKATIQFEILKLETESNNDVLNIYDGPDENAELLASVSGELQNAIFTSKSNRLFLRFFSNSNAQDKGWLVKYKTIIPVYVSDTTIYYDAKAAEFTDGSGAFDYYNNINYNWIIQPENTNYISVTIDTMNTEPGKDDLEIYDLQYSTPTFLKKINGNGNNIEYRFKTNKLLVKFTSGASVSDKGWRMHYNSEYLFEGSAGLYNFIYFPNPAENQLNLHFEFKGAMDASIEITNSFGLPIYLQQLKKFSGIYNDIIDISSLDKGVYIIQLKSETNTITKKFEKF